MIIDTLQQARAAFDTCLEKKGRQVRLLGVGDLTIVADYFIVATVESAPQAAAMGRAVQEKLRDLAGRRAIGVEGQDSGWWVLVDYGDFVVHIFMAEAREYYAIDETWADAKIIAESEGELRKAVGQ
ncbi:MAG: ribosome silencing factor [Planctomycetes bacterium]|nr:ribosome silencing factor [Planctomycetota bacterium]